MLLPTDSREGSQSVSAAHTAHGCSSRCGRWVLWQDLEFFGRLVGECPGFPSERVKGPRRLVALQEGSLKGAGVGCPPEQHNEPVGREEDWRGGMNRERFLRLRENKRIYVQWKKGRVTPKEKLLGCVEGKSERPSLNSAWPLGFKGTRSPFTKTSAA